MNTRRILSQTALITGTLLFSAGIQTFAAFTQPTTSPPNSDTYAPISTGPTAQSKSGGLLLNTGGAANGLIVQAGNVGIGTTNPQQRLDVRGGFLRTEGIMYADETMQTSASITNPQFSQPIVIRNTDGHTTLDGGEGEHILWYNICPSKYELISCSLSATYLSGWTVSIWTINGGGYNSYSPTGSMWDFWVIHNSDISGVPGYYGTVNYSNAEQKYSGGRDKGACVMRYTCSGPYACNGWQYPGVHSSDFMLQARCISVR